MSRAILERVPVISIVADGEPSWQTEPLNFRKRLLFEPRGSVKWDTVRAELSFSLYANLSEKYFDLSEMLWSPPLKQKFSGVAPTLAEYI